jgi:tetratricopeptide (TPR) repeat protein
MMRSQALLISLLLSSVLLFHGGCSSTRSARDTASGDYAYSATWLLAAEAMERKGDLQAALYNLRVARTASRRDKRINAAIKRLEVKIANLSKKKMAQGKRAVRQGKLSQAKRYYLKVLSLDPKHKQALEALREIEKRASEASMKKKVVRSNRNYNNRAKKATLPKGFQEEAYIYSRQAILQAQDTQTSPEEYINEIEKHLHKYPKDKVVRERLSKTLLKQIDTAFESENYNDALKSIQRAERAFSSDTNRLKAIQQRRKAFGKKLYMKGVKRLRDEPKLAITYWEYALQFDPDDKKSRLRLRNIQSL